MLTWRIACTRDCFYLLFIMMWGIRLLVFSSGDVQVSLSMFFMSKKRAAYDEVIFIRHANELFEHCTVLSATAS